MKLLAPFRYLIFAFLLLSCYDNPLDVTVPTFSEGGFIDQTKPLSQSVKAKIEGVYNVKSGSDRFGDKVVIKIAGDRMSVFMGKNAGYFILKSGSLDSVLFFEGYWRFQTGTETGLARLYIGRDEGGKFLFGDTTSSSVIKLQGNFGDGNSAPTTPVLFEYARPLSPQAVAKKFWAIAHHGFMTSDNMPASENSVEVIRILERYGANAAELDVRLSKDRIPFLYHDNTLNPRLVQRSPLVGSTEEYTMAELKTFVRLLHGEQIPTVEEVLLTVLKETNLKLVWLDLKTTDVEMIKEIVPIQKRVLAMADSMVMVGARDSLEIVIGLPTDSHVAEFLALPNYQTIPALCELELSDVRNTGAIIWGPRWTRGLLLDEVTQMHNEGRRVFSWTVSVTGYIQSYLREGQFDGMISDYPSLVNYYRYIN